LLLSIDTSAGTSVAVFNNDCLSFVSFDDPFGHAENIGDALAQALLDAGIAPEQLTGIAVARGPAPYTGLRVGMAAATSLSKALAIPLYGIITLDAIALGRNAQKLLVVTDAKRRELFAATYQSGNRTAGPMLISPSQLNEFEGYEILQQSSTAKMIGDYALRALRQGSDISDLSALYLRSPDVTPSSGKKVSG
jgi:tRNA threonylcarbamoyl adenosine modification protein YeaZ